MAGMEAAGGGGATQALAAGRPAWMWAAGGLLAAGVVAATLIPAVRQRAPGEFSTGNGQSAAITVVEQGAQEWAAAERALSAGDGRRAVAHYRRAVSFLPQRSDLRVRFGFALAQVERPEEAVTQLRFAVRRAPELPEARLYLGAVLLGAGRPDEAAAQWRRYLSLSPRGQLADVVRDQLRRVRGSTRR